MYTHMKNGNIHASNLFQSLLFLQTFNLLSLLSRWVERNYFLFKSFWEPVDEEAQTPPAFASFWL